MRVIKEAFLFVTAFGLFTCCQPGLAESAQFRLDPEQPQRFRLDPERAALKSQEQALLKALDELKLSDAAISRKLAELGKDLKSVHDAMDKVEHELKRIRIDMMS
jgi:hypothetical protein